MNINESLMNKVRALRESSPNTEDDLKFLDGDDYEDYSDPEVNFGEEAVEAGNHFNLDGDDFTWSKPFSEIVNFENYNL